jgi:hypothetical protein
MKFVSRLGVVGAVAYAAYLANKKYQLVDKASVLANAAVAKATEVADGLLTKAFEVLGDPSAEAHQDEEEQEPAPGPDVRVAQAAPSVPTSPVYGDANVRYGAAPGVTYPTSGEAWAAGLR